MLERRRILKIIVAGATTVMVPGSITMAASGPVERAGTRGSLRDQLATLVGSNFQLTDADGVTRKAQLISIEDGPACPGLEQFSMLFEGEGLTEGLHEIHHTRTGSALISLVPSDQPETGLVRQRAHFSHFV